MESLINFIWFIFIIVLLLGILLVIKYNSIQEKIHSVKEAKSNLTGLMQKRVDLTNKLIDIVRGYSDHEKLTYISLSEIENSNNRDINISTNKEIETVIYKTHDIVKDHPKLKADKSYLQLMSDIKELEAELQRKREIYNRCAKIYNLNRSSFPLFLVAGSIGLKPANYYDVESLEEIKKSKDFDNTDADILRDQLLEIGKRVKNKTIDRIEKINSKGLDSIKKNNEL